MKTLCTRILMAAALMGALVLTATTTSEAAEAQADVSGPGPKEGNGSGDDAAELAKKLQNPVANLISVPIQNNWDFGIGPEDAMRYLVNVQPVIPFSLNRDWNLITRTILPFIHMESPLPGGGDTGGIGDILQSFFFSPKVPVGGWIVGGGPAFLYPSASDDTLGAEKWGAGPTAVLLKQEKGWTYGLLTNHVWSFAGSDSARMSAPPSSSHSFPTPRKHTPRSG